MAQKETSNTMKIRACIIGIEDCGDTLAIKVQGKTVGAASWIGEKEMQIVVPATSRNNRTYHNARVLEITVKPK